MIETDRLVFLELQKCASTRIASILLENVGGQQVGKHDRLPAPTTKPVIGSVRNPWAWYVSHWAFACSGRGQLRRHDLRSTSFLGDVVRGARVSLQSRRAPAAGLLYARARRARHRPPALYADSGDPRQFRTWLRSIMHRSTGYRHDLRYAASGTAGTLGYMTYLYLYLYSRDVQPLLRGAVARSPGTVLAFDRAQNVCGERMVRTEHLADDLMRVLGGIDPELARRVGSHVHGQAAVTENPSSHDDWESYYDQAHADLVAERDALIIARYGYTPPVIAPSRDAARAE